MPCQTLRLPGRGYAIACTRGRSRRAKCACGAPHTRLCDAPAPGGTCDRPLCDRCAVPAGANRDLCPPHKEVRL